MSSVKRARIQSFLTALAVLGFALVPNFSQAGTTYTAFSGLTPIGSADITISGNTITVALSDLVVDPGSVADNLSAVTINLSGNVTLTAESHGAFTARTVNGDGTFSDVAKTASDQTGWVLQASSTTMSTLQFDVLADGSLGHDPVTLFTHGGPDGTILGVPNSGTGIYTNANNSIAGNGPHNPFIAGALGFTETFTLSAPFTGTISSVSLQFNTDDHHNVVPTTPTEDHHDTQPTPEPGSLIVWGGLGLVGVALMRRRRKAA
jgi:MYXO-CTERM domain-containing protein